jgi:hypothetical protein
MADIDGYKVKDRSAKTGRRPMPVNGIAFKRLLIDRAAKVQAPVKVAHSYVHPDPSDCYSYAECHRKAYGQDAERRPGLAADGYTPTVRGWKNG